MGDVWPKWWEQQRLARRQQLEAYQSLTNVLNKPVKTDFFSSGARPSFPRPTWLSLILAFFGSSRFAVPLVRLCLVFVPHLVGEVCGPRFVPATFAAVTLAELVLLTTEEEN